MCPGMQHHMRHGWGTETDLVNHGWNNIHVGVNSNNGQFSYTETDSGQCDPTALAKSGRLPFLACVSKTLMHYKHGWDENSCHWDYSSAVIKKLQIS